jgi:hypothetical protein
MLVELRQKRPAAPASLQGQHRPDALSPVLLEQRSATSSSGRAAVNDRAGRCGAMSEGSGTVPSAPAKGTHDWLNQAKTSQLEPAVTILRPTDHGGVLFSPREGL